MLLSPNGGYSIDKEVAMRVLVIDANPRTLDYAHSKWAADQYIQALKGNGHFVEIWPIYQMNIPVIDEDVIKVMDQYSHEMKLNPDVYEKMEHREIILNRFLRFDHYVVVSPLWNFSIPPQLKALIDTIAIEGKTFVYTKEGTKGLLKGSFVHIQASGRTYETEVEFSSQYISHMFSFLGLEEKLSLLIEGTNHNFQRSVYQDTLDDWIKKSIKSVN